nr:hypothetical protein [Paenibacillus phyllosphaerae]
MFGFGLSGSAYASDLPNPEPDEALDPRAARIEQALLQQLKPAIDKALNEIFQEQYAQFNCEQIVSINERETFRGKRGEARPVDAIHGALYFEIGINLCRPNGDRIELTLKNDTANAQYYLAGYKITPAVNVHEGNEEDDD